MGEGNTWLSANQLQTQQTRSRQAALEPAVHVSDSDELMRLKTCLNISTLTSSRIHAGLNTESVISKKHSVQPVLHSDEADLHVLSLKSKP